MFTWQLDTDAAAFNTEDGHKTNMRTCWRWRTASVHFRLGSNGMSKTYTALWLVFQHKSAEWEAAASGKTMFDNRQMKEVLCRELWVFLRKGDAQKIAAEMEKRITDQGKSFRREEDNMRTKKSLVNLKAGQFVVLAKHKANMNRNLISRVEEWLPQGNIWMFAQNNLWVRLSSFQGKFCLSQKITFSNPKSK